MTLRDRPLDRVVADRDRVEESVLLPVIARELRALLRRLSTRASLSATRNAVLLASADPSIDPTWPTLGEVAGWWGVSVDDKIVEAVRRAWIEGYRSTREGEVTARSLDAVADYMAAVRDRLVRGITPPIAEDAFDHVRVDVTRAVAQGWSRKKLAERIAVDLSWAPHHDYWRNEYARITREIEAILDPLGPPGGVAREYARLNDPRVDALRRDRNAVVARLDDEEGYWARRATLIARTEATGATNFASLSALTDEGVETKSWIAVGDGRTRATHRAASGQEVAIGSKFDVGGYALAYPGDPTGPVQEVANCRCSVLGA